MPSIPVAAPTYGEVTLSLDLNRQGKSRSDDGFTLIELLVVVVIIGILIAIAIPLYLNYKQSAYVTSTKADLHTLQLAEERYMADHSTYGTSRQLSADNPSMKMSSGSMAAVVWSNSSAYCVAGENIKGTHDGNAPLANYGYPYKTYFFDSGTGKISTDTCPQPGDATGLDGYFDETGAR